MIIAHSNVLITGGHGLLGRALISSLRRSGAHELLTPDRAELDLLDRKAVHDYFERHRPAYVFHLAAQVFGLGGNLSNQILAISNNTLINDNVFLAAARFAPKKIFFSGTVATYPHPYDSLPLREDQLFFGEPHYGEFGYAHAKRHALAYLTLLQKERGIAFVAGLLTNLYGPNDRFDVVNGHVIPSLVRKIYDSKTYNTPLDVWGDGTSSRDFMYASDAADAILVAFAATDGVVNVASGSTHTIRDVVNALRDASGFDGPINWQSDKPTGIKERSVSVDRLTRLGFKPARSLAEGLRETYEWYAANRSVTRK